MSKNSDLKNKLAAKANGNQVAEKPKNIYDLINSMKPEIQRALPKHLDADRVARIAITAIRTTPKLQQCNPYSFLGALMQASQLGLEPNTPLGQAYIIPYGNEAQFQIGYKGLLDLAYRSGQFKSIYAHEVYENDEFEYEYGLEQKLTHKPAAKDRGNVIGYYAVFHLQNGGYGFAYMSREDVEKHAQEYSQAVKKGWTSPWKTNFDEMAKKTVLKKVLKYAPLSVEMARNLSADETIKTEIAEDMSEVFDVTPEYIPEDELDKVAEQISVDLPEA
ncbi:MAG: recombination protein RecT [Clostridia bacterium]|nr:recombination protein RecT [Clostridia bacterium]